MTDNRGPIDISRDDTSCARSDSRGAGDIRPIICAAQRYLTARFPRPWIWWLTVTLFPVESCQFCRAVAKRRIGEMSERTGVVCSTGRMATDDNLPSTARADTTSP